MPFSFEAALAKTEPFAKVDHAHLSKFAEVASPQTYVEGQVITRQGDLGTGLYVITRGSANVVVNHGQPDEKKIAELPEGQAFGDMALFLERPRGASIVAREATECFVIHRADFKRLAMDNPEVLWNMCEMYADRLQKADEALGQLSHH